MTGLGRARLCAVIAVLLLAAWELPRPASADETGRGAMPPISQSGYERIRGAGGPDSVARSLLHHDATKDSFYRGHAIQDAVAPDYRLQVSQNVGITPDVEVIFDPSKNPNESVIGVFSLRLQLAF